MRKEFVSRQQLEMLPERIRKAEETDATKELKQYMWEMFEKNSYFPMKIMIVGDGNSYPAALFAKRVVSYEMRTSNVDAVTPQVAISILTQFDNVNNGDWNPKYDLIIGISYSGKTNDIKCVSDFCERRFIHFVLVTGAEKSTLSTIYKESYKLKIVSYFNPKDTTGEEKDMVSMFETLAPIIIFDDDCTTYSISENQGILQKGEEFVSKLNIPIIARAIKQCPVIHVFYEPDTLPAAVDIRNKFTESGIANVVLHEKKNFSQGQYTILYNQNFALVINLIRYSWVFNEDGLSQVFRSEYDEKLDDFLRRRCQEKNANYIKFPKIAHSSTLYNIETMMKFPYLITAIGEELEIDVSNPLKSFPEEAKELQEYKGKF